MTEVFLERTEVVRERYLRSLQMGVDTVELRDASIRAKEAQAARDAAFADLKSATLHAVEDGMSESAAAFHAGVDRMTVRRWLGKR